MSSVEIILMVEGLVVSGLLFWSLTQPTTGAEMIVFKCSSIVRQWRGGLLSDQEAIGYIAESVEEKDID